MGRKITARDIEMYKSARLSGCTQKVASAIASFSERTAQRIEAGEYLSSRERHWRTCKDPFEGAQSEIERILQSNRNIKAVELLRELQALYPGKFENDKLRTLQRRAKKWRDSNRRDSNHKCMEDSKKCLEWMHRLSQGEMSIVEQSDQLSEKLTSEELFTLFEYILNRSIRYRNRAIAILSYLRGFSDKIIASFLLIDVKSVKRYVQSYQEHGISKLFDFSRKEIKKSQDIKYKNKVFEILHSPPADHGINRTSWKMEDLHRLMNEAGLKIALGNIRKIIRNAGYKVRTAKKVLTSTDPDYREKLEKITQILENLGSEEKFFSIDEYGPFAVKMQGGKSLVAPGEEKIVPQWQKSKGKLILTAAIELSTNQVTHFYSDKKDTEEMIKLLDILLEKYADEECIYLSWDAASWHASYALYERVEKVNSSEYKKEHKSPTVKLAPLPASAQFLNIIESIFSGMARAIIHNSNYQSIEECKAAIDRYFLERNQHFKDNPKRAGNKIWGKERVEVEFRESNNCKDPRWR